MERFPGFTSDLQFIEKLVSEESVHVLPGKCFNYPGYIRLVLTLPYNLLSEAMDRIHSFCSRHLLCPPPSRLVNLLVENRSLYVHMERDMDSLLITLMLTTGTIPGN